MTTFDDILGAAARHVGLDPAALIGVLPVPERREFAPGEWLFRESTPREWFGVVARGEVQVIRGLLGVERMVGRLGVGAMVAEGVLLSDEPHATSARTAEGAAVWIVPRGDLERVRDEHPELYYRLLAHVAQRLSERLGVAAEQLASLGHQPSLVTGHRVEHDSLGPRELPNHAYWGAQTSRALENFPLSGIPMSHFSHLVNAFAYVKKAAALANAELGVLDEARRDAIVAVCDELLTGALHDQFVVDMFQGGAGTSSNMNVNEVIANRGLELLGHARGEYAHLHPNDHVNKSQSTNDAYPTAVKLATFLSSRDLAEALGELERAALAAKATEFAGVLKMGRTELQDAVPMTLGQEFGAYAVMVGEASTVLDRAAADLLAVSLGATAIGTGLACPAGYGVLAIEHLATVTGLPTVQSVNLVEATQDSGEFVGLSAAMKRAALQISKICNDLRLLSSGPRAGFNEIRLPPMQPGSSIMPGKVNPVIPEVVSEVCFQIVGYDVTVGMAAHASELELNMAEPIIAYDLLHGLMLLKNAVIVLTSRCIAGIEANVEVCRGYVESSIGLVTALIPYIGYERGVLIAHEAMATGRGVYELVLTKGWLDKEHLDDILSPENMLHPRAVP